MKSTLRHSPVSIVLLCLILLPTLLKAASYVPFTFHIPDNGQDPFAREIWATVKEPDSSTVRLPAFYAGKGDFSVRAFTGATGTYFLVTVFETAAGKSITLTPTMVSPRQVEITRPDSHAFIRVNPKAPRQFVGSNGEPFVPIGTNLAWPPSQGKEQTNSGGLDFYRKTFSKFQANNLNWTRIWMASWSDYNLDWLPKTLGPSPKPGDLSLKVADRWDRLISLAENYGVHIQLVLQHHGQYSSEVNPEWAANPWNAANPGGFLKNAADFFTSPKAIALTKRKFRYVVARWGYSPAIFSWELFNEVHWVDAIRIDHDEAAVARWHNEMAAYIRSIDAYHHPVTTSFVHVASPINADLDYLQPHLYAFNMIDAARWIGNIPGKPKPVFYGECGDDHSNVAPDAKAAGIGLLTPVWASIVGQSSQPAQTWYGDKLIANHRLPELGALATILRKTHLLTRKGLTPFSPPVASDNRIPLTLIPGYLWFTQPPVNLQIAFDGREPAQYARIPGILVGSTKSMADGYPSWTILRIDRGKATNARLVLGDAGVKGAEATILLNGEKVGSHTWPPSTKSPADEKTSTKETNIDFRIPPGPQILTIENTGGLDWFRFRKLELDATVPILAAAGKRDDRFLFLWVWNRNGVNALHPPKPSTADLIIQDLPAGSWKVIWWNTADGRVTSKTTVQHRRGELRLKTPPIARHAAVSLERIDRNL